MSSVAQTLVMLSLLGHFALVVTLYVALTVERMRAVRSGEAKLGDFVRATGDPRRAARIQRNLANQFEAPLFAYFAAAYLLSVGALMWIDAIAAMLFLVGRVIHTLVQTMGDNVRLRGQVFVINFTGILMLMAHVAWDTVQRALS
jgi:hypothetical protein